MSNPTRERLKNIIKTYELQEEVEELNTYIGYLEECLKDNCISFESWLEKNYGVPE